MISAGVVEALAVGTRVTRLCAFTGSSVLLRFNFVRVQVRV
jgi:hypothetical protein